MTSFIFPHFPVVQPGKICQYLIFALIWFKSISYKEMPKRYIQRNYVECAREMAQQLRVHTVFTENPSSFPNTYIGRFPTACNSTSSKSDIAWSPKMMVYILY